MEDVADGGYCSTVGWCGANGGEGTGLELETYLYDIERRNDEAEQ